MSQRTLIVVEKTIKEHPPSGGHLHKRVLLCCKHAPGSFLVALLNQIAVVTLIRASWCFILRFNHCHSHVK